MKRVLTLLGIGLLVLVLQGALASFVPRPWCPDFGLLFVIALGLHWRSRASGLALASLLGYAADGLSGSLLGQHALLRMAVFTAAWMGSRQLNLRGPLPLAVFTVAVALLYALCLWSLTSFFGGAPFRWSALPGAIPHALLTALFAPSASRGVERLVGRLGDEEGARRVLRLEPRGRAA